MRSHIQQLAARSHAKNDNRCQFWHVAQRVHYKEFMLTLHIANKNYSSWSLRPWLLLTECGIPFHEELHIFAPGGNHAAFRKFSPNGKVPCLVDGATAPAVVVWDSLAIVEYVAEQHANVWPSDRVARAWARSTAAEMHSGFAALRSQCSMSVGVRVQLHAVSAATQADLNRVDELWCEGLHRFGGPFLAGANFTAVDAFFAPVVFRLLTYGLQLSAPAMAYATRMRDLPSMQNWYRAGLAEISRDVGHDEEILQHGRIVEDLRATA